MKNGYIANFLITSGEVFNEETIIYENWVNGNRNIINSMSTQDIRGDYENAPVVENSTFKNKSSDSRCHVTIFFFRSVMLKI